MGLVKPITGTPLDLAHPLSRTLLAAFVPQSREPFLDPCGAPWTLLSGPNRVPGRTGSAVGYNGVNEAHLNNTIALPTGGCTVALLLMSPDSASTGSSFGNRDILDSSFGAYRLQAHLPYAGTIYWDYGGFSGANRLSWTPGSGWFGSWHALVFRAGPSGSSIWSDGVSMASQGTAIVRSDGNRGFSVGAWVGTDSSLYNPNTIEALYLAGREWSDREISAWTADPYAMFLTRKSPSRSFVPAPAGPGPFPSFVDDAMTGGFTSMAGF